MADITEHYVQHYVYLTDAYYETLFGQAPETNTILADFPPRRDGSGELEAQLVSLDGVTSLSLLSDIEDTFSSSLESVDLAVVFIILCAAALDFVVLMNLTNINITERLRELATLKVLGFYNREVSAYIYRENVILTIFGVLAGMVLGKFLHQWLILTVEIDMVMFDRVLDRLQLSCGPPCTDGGLLPGGEPHRPEEAAGPGHGGGAEERGVRNFGRGTWDLPSFGRAEYGGVKLPAWWEAPPKIGGCTPNRAGGAGTLGVRGIFSPVHARGKYD